MEDTKEEEPENPPEASHENLQENETENPPDLSENPPDLSENPPKSPPVGDEVVEESTPENPPKADDFFSEAPTELLEHEEGEETAFINPEEEQFEPVTGEGDNEDRENDIVLDTRPPPMAPPPAIFYPEDTIGNIHSPGITDEFLMERGFKHEIKKHEVPEEKPIKGKQQKTTKLQPTYPFRAVMKTDRELDKILKQTAPKHDYCGFIYSCSTERPQGGFTNYFLPIYPQPQGKQHICMGGIPIPLNVIHLKKTAQQNLLPLSTIKVTWSSNRIRTIYTPESIYAYLTRFGPIDAIYAKSVNSVYVIFSDLEAARETVTYPHLGKPWDPLIAFWLEPRMYNASFYYKYAAIENPPQRIRI